MSQDYFPQTDLGRRAWNVIAQCRWYRDQIGQWPYALQRYNQYRIWAIRLIRELETKANVPHRPAELLKPKKREIKS